MKNTTTERPILFSGPMVKAILEGRKAMTRRVVKPEPEFGVEAASVQHEDGKAKAVFQSLSNCSGITVACPYGRPGDRLWVRETWAYECGGGYLYKASHLHMVPGDNRWRPSIHMPRAASRILLKITEIRVERLKDITASDCVCEGIEFESDIFTTYNKFRRLWQSINGPESWAKNPWVWVIEFKKI